MKWSAIDMETYLQQQAYIDTLLIPLVRIETNVERLRNGASESDFLMHLSSYIESQFKGRLMLAPPFSYTHSMDKEQLTQQLQTDFQPIGFKHILFLTTDVDWRSTTLGGQAVFLTPIPIESMDISLRQSIMEDQLKIVLPQLTNMWAKV